MNRLPSLRWFWSFWIICPFRWCFLWSQFRVAHFIQFT